MENQYKGSIVWHTIGKLLMIVAGSMVFPLVTAFLYQEKNCIYIFALLLPFVLLIGALLSFLPVSYTHLDVYKRQVLH